MFEIPQGQRNIHNFTEVYWYKGAFIEENEIWKAYNMRKRTSQTLLKKLHWFSITVAIIALKNPAGPDVQHANMKSPVKNGNHILKNINL